MFTVLSKTHNQNKMAAAFMVAAINAVTAHTKTRIMSIDMEDGSGQKFNVKTGDYEFQTWSETTYYVEVQENMEARVVYNKSRYKDYSGNWVENA